MEFSRELFFARHPDPMWVYEVATLRFLEVNDAAVSRYGYSRDEFLAMTIADIRPPEDVPRLLDAVRAVTDEQQAPQIWRHRYRSGEKVYVEILSQALDFRGVKAELVVARDISKQVQIEQERAELLQLSDELYESNQRLREQEANLRTSHRLPSLGIWKMNRDTGALAWSDNAYAMYSVTREAFGHDFASYVALVHPDDRNRIVAGIHAVIARSGDTCATCALMAAWRSWSIAVSSFAMRPVAPCACWVAWWT